MKIGVLGVGGVGGYYGARLVHAGHDVSFLARPEQAEVLKWSGLRIQSELGNLHIGGVQVVTDATRAEPVELLIVAVKLWDTEPALRSWLPVIGKETAVLSLQNGVDKDEIIGAIIGIGHVLGGVTYIIADRTAPGVIVHSGLFQRIVVGEMDGTESLRVRTVVSACASAGIDVSASTEIRSETWKKFIFLSSVSVVTSATRRTIGNLRTDPSMRSELHNALREATALARAEEVSIPDGFADDRLAFIDTLPSQARSSMAQDLFRGRRLELEWLSGAVVRRAARHRLAVPTHEKYYKQLFPFINGTRDPERIPVPIG